MFTDGLQIIGDTAELLAGRLAGVSLLLLGAALALHVFKLGARARAWHRIVGDAYPAEELRYRHSLGAYLAGIGVNAVVPVRSGELLKIALVKRQAAGTRYRGLASTLVTESVFDSVIGAIALTAGFVVGWTTFGRSLGSTLAPLTGNAWPAGAAALAVAAAGALFARRPLARTLRRMAGEAGRGFAVLRSPCRYLRLVVSWQLAALMLRLASIYCFLAAFHIAATFQATLLVFAVQCAAGMIPLTPNGAGAQQALLVLVLGTSASTSSIIRFGAGAQLVTALADVALAIVALALMTGSLRWRRLLAHRVDATAELDQGVETSVPSAA
jgi:hypothetical protein